MTTPLPLSSTEAHCWSFINAQINLPLLSLSPSLSLQQLSAVHLLMWLSQPVSYHHVFSLHSLLCLSPSICSPICSPSLLFTSFPISNAFPAAALWVVIRENYNSVANKWVFFFFFFGFSCCILFRERMTEKWLQRKNLLSLLRALKNAPPLRIQERVSHQTAGPNGTAKLMQS